MIVLVLLITAACIYVPWNVVSDTNSPHQVGIGPNLLYFWPYNHILSLDGTYSLKSYGYFELSQDNIVKKQATVEVPKPGESQATYWIRDYPMTGVWRVNSSTTIFSLESSVVTSTPDPWHKGENIALGSFLGFVAWVCLLAVLFWLDNAI
jgi:hypothetical protein